MLRCNDYLFSNKLFLKKLVKVYKENTLNKAKHLKTTTLSLKYPLILLNKPFQIWNGFIFL